MTGLYDHERVEPSSATARLEDRMRKVDDASAADVDRVSREVVGNLGREALEAIDTMEGWLKLRGMAPDFREARHCLLREMRKVDPNLEPTP